MRIRSSRIGRNVLALCGPGSVIPSKGVIPSFHILTVLVKYIDGVVPIRNSSNTLVIEL